MRSKEKSVKFPARNAQDSPGKNTICELNFGEIEIQLRFFVLKTTKCAYFTAVPQNIYLYATQVYFDFHFSFGVGVIN